MRRGLSLSGAMVALLLATQANADSITVEHVAVSAQGGAQDFGVTNAQLPSTTYPAPIALGTTGAVLNSMQTCVVGDPACPTTGTSPIIGGLEVRFTNLDVVCAGTSDCDAFGLGFGFTGHIDGTYTFQSALTDLATSVAAGTFIYGNIVLELEIPSLGFDETHNLSFDSRFPTGAPAPITLTGHGEEYVAHGTMIAVMPAGSALKVEHSAEFTFTPVPEPASAAPLALAGLLGLWRLRRKRPSLSSQI